MIEMLNCDCMDYMATLPDKAFELAIVDPPYGIGVDGQKESICKNPKHNRKLHERKEWDSAIPTASFFEELERVSENQIIWGGNYFVPHLTHGTKGWIVWDKGQHGLTMSDCELAYSSFNVPTRVFTKNRVALLQDGTIHPTQKPVALYKWLLSRYAKPGDKILDTHGGSGSICIACHDLGYDLTWMELDEDYYKAAVARYKNHAAQATLFDPAELTKATETTPELFSDGSEAEE